MVHRRLAERQLALVYELNAQLDSIAFVIARPGDDERLTQAYLIGQCVLLDTGHVLSNLLEPLSQRRRHDDLVAVEQFPMVRHRQAVRLPPFRREVAPYRRPDRPGCAVAKPEVNDEAGIPGPYAVVINLHNLHGRCARLPSGSNSPIVWRVPSAIWCASSRKLGRLAGGPIETPAPAKTTSRPSRSALSSGSGKSVLPILIRVLPPS